MNYKRELEFFQRIAKQLHLSVHILPADREQFANIDFGLRADLGVSEQDCQRWETRVRQSLKDNVIYQLVDEFSCKYTALCLPHSAELQILIVGPYTTEEMTPSWFQSLTKQSGINPRWLPLLEKYLRLVPYLHSEELLYAAANSLGECIWGTQNFSWEHIISGVPEAWMPLLKSPDAQSSPDMLSNLSGIERRYESENRLMQVISQGRSHTAELMLANFSRAALEQRTSEPSRDIKNYSIILNTIMRKAVEQGGVHPIYIDRLSSDFAVRIEALTAWKDFAELWQEMARKYCLLVKKHANREYSPLVQKVLARVDFDLAADLSLKANANVLNVNASYLSTLFKRETGVTLTDYVNRKRIEHAIFLLNTTTLSISVIGQRCGIQDDNYFTKIFKKYTNKTPKQYRQESNRFSK